MALANGLTAGPASNRVRAEVDQLLTRYHVENGPGCAVGVLLSNRIEYEGAFGTADGRSPLAVSTPIYIASVAKQFTAAAVYLLARSGKLNLNDSIRRYLPEVPESAHAVTAQQLLNHTSGLRDYSALQEVAGRQDPIDNRGVLQLISEQGELNFEPGTNYEYSNSEYVLLSVLVERISGVPLAQYAKEQIFEPLGLTHSWFRSTEFAKGESVLGFEFRDGSFQVIANLPHTTGDGGMYSSVSDLLRWMQNLERPKLGGEAIHQLQLHAQLTSGEVIPHASGLFWNKHNGLATISHNGATPGFQADVVRFPRQHLSVICLCNRGDVNAASLSRQIADVFLGMRGMTPAPVIESRRLPPPDIAGYWESRQGFILSIKIDGDHLKASLAGADYKFVPGAKRNEFFSESDGFHLFLRRPEPDKVELNWESDRSVSFSRLPGAMVSPFNISNYTGRFANTDLDSKWRLVVIHGTLHIATDAGWNIPLAPAGPDRFEAGPWVLEFRRKGGTIFEFQLHRERLWRLSFEKLDRD